MSTPIYDRTGQPINMARFDDLLRDPEYKIVEKTGLPRAGIEVSTVWLGIDHSWGRGDGDPIIFETMVFGGNLAHAQERYSTEEQARRGHARWVEDAEQEAKEFQALRSSLTVQWATAVLRKAASRHLAAHAHQVGEWSARADLTQRLVWGDDQ